MLAKNATEVITCVHTSHHKKSNSSDQPIQKIGIHKPIKVIGSSKTSTSTSINFTSKVNLTNSITNRYSHKHNIRKP